MYRGKLIRVAGRLLLGGGLGIAFGIAILTLARIGLPFALIVMVQVVGGLLLLLDYHLSKPRR